MAILEATDIIRQFRQYDDIVTAVNRASLVKLRDKAFNAGASALHIISRTRISFGNIRKSRTLLGEE